MTNLTLKISIAQLCTKFELDTPASHEITKNIFKNFISDGKPKFTIKANKKINIKDPLFTYKNEKEKINIAVNAGYIDLEKRRYELPDLGVQFGNLTRYAIFNLSRICYASLLILHNGFLIHGCGIADNGKGYLFIGPPESGKTTIAKKSTGKTVLSDDCSAVRCLKNKWYIFGTPWGGRENIGCKLSTIFFLKKADKLKIKKLKKSSSFLSLLSQFILPIQKEMYKILDITHSLNKNVASYELYSPLSGDIWSEIKKNA